MGMLIWVAGALALLWGWLSGHWFARALMFLGLLAIGVMMTGWSGFGVGVGSAAVWIMMSGIAAWFVSGIPAYVIRWRHRDTLASMARRTALTAPYPG